MTEYCIYVQISSGKPFIIEKFNNLQLAKISLYNMVSLEEERGRVYYVDNDFFKNKYSFNHNGRYMQLQSREVTDWQIVSENDINRRNDNIIFYNF